MQVSNPNNIKIYNLSAGKSIPQWISERKRRTLQKRDVDIRRRIELIQDFEMPGVSDRVQMSKNGQFIIATGSYKPRVRCYDVSQFSMKFERCFDAEIVNFAILSEDYSKIVFLQCDRYIELHVQHGKYYRLRIPRFGRDLVYNSANCDLYLVGDSPEIYRLNLEQGIFLSPFVSNALEFNVCKLNPVHNLLICGSTEGQIEAWDPRIRNRVGILDCAKQGVTSEAKVKSLPSITSLAFSEGLTMGVGTANGQVLLYDLRSDKPFLVKSHLYGLPVRNVEFVHGQDLVASMDSKIIRFWGRTSGKTLTTIEPGVDLNELCLVPKTGLMFVANEEKKILTYYIPSLGHAPSWCSFLDNLTEEMEEDAAGIVYDDYKFVTRKELDDIGLGQLIGTNLLRAYMHGYFVDASLYRKAKSAFVPFNYKEYRQTKIREKLNAESVNRVKIAKPPSVNPILAEKLATKRGLNILHDRRFGEMFNDPDFQVDETSEEYRLLNPIVKNHDKRQQRITNAALHSQFERESDEDNDNDDDDGRNYVEEDSSDDDRGWVSAVREQHKIIKNERRHQRRAEDANASIKPSFYSLKTGEEYKNSIKSVAPSSLKKTLAERLQEQDSVIDKHSTHSSLGHRQLTFTFKKTKTHDDKTTKRQEERKEFVRPARGMGRGRSRGRGRGRSWNRGRGFNRS